MQLAPRVNNIVPSIQKRKFHTNNIKSTNINNESEIKITNKIAKSEYLLYFEKLSNIINDSTLSDLQKQELFENFLYNYIEEQLDSEDKLIKRFLLYNTSNVKNLLLQALDSLILHKDKIKNKDLQKNLFDKFNIEKNGLRLILITYSIIISYYNRLGYTAIAAQIGKIIIELLYLTSLLVVVGEGILPTPTTTKKNIIIIVIKNI
jgi:hypothetical protein